MRGAPSSDSSVGNKYIIKIGALPTSFNLSPETLFVHVTGLRSSTPRTFSDVLCFFSYREVRKNVPFSTLLFSMGLGPLLLASPRNKCPATPRSLRLRQSRAIQQRPRRRLEQCVLSPIARPVHVAPVGTSSARVPSTPLPPLVANSRPFRRRRRD